MEEKIEITTSKDDKKVFLDSDFGAFGIFSDSSDWFERKIPRNLARAQRCTYCNVLSEEFDVCPHCGAPK